MLTLVWPWAVVLLPLPWLLYKAMPAAVQQEAALFVPFLRSLQGMDSLAEASGRWGLLKGFFLVLIWVLLVSAACRPQFVGDPVALPVTGRDVLLAVDISGSMAQEDMVLHGKQVTRIAMVKEVVNEFISRRTGDRLGLLLFGTQAYIQTPLTFDLKTVQILFNEAQLGFAGKQTAIGDAVGLAVKRLQERPDEGRVLILLTDGQNTAGEVEPLQAAKLAAQIGVVIYTIGVGADQMVVRSLFGSRRVNPSADLDEETLASIAEITGGRYFRARNPEELESIYARIDELEPVDQESETFRPVQALFYLPLGLALLLSFAMALFPVAAGLVDLGREG